MDLTATVTDKAGHTATRTLTVMVGQTVVDNTSPSIVYTGDWHPAASGPGGVSSTEKYTFTPGDWWSLGFTGPSVAFAATVEPHGGKADVSIDGTVVATVDFYAATQAGGRTLFSTTSLSSGAHTIKVVLRSDKNPASDATVMTLEAVTVGATAPPPSGNRSGLAWKNLLWPYRNVGTAAGYTAATKYQEQQCGRLVDGCMAAQYNNQWADIEGLQILQFLADYQGCMPVLMLPPWPNGQGTWTAAASGTYNTHWVKAGQAMAALTTGKFAVRPAWESNGNWYDWSVVSKGGYAAFKAGWQQMITSLRQGLGSRASDMTVSYSLSGLDSYGGDPLANAPDPAYWDVLGIDYYDWNPATTSATSPGRLDMLTTALNFAVSKGKQIALDEWGLHHTGASGEGGDNPLFIEAIFGWVQANLSHVAWVNYFQDDAANNVNSGLFSPDVNNNPNSRAAYLAAIA